MILLVYQSLTIKKKIMEQNFIAMQRDAFRAIMLKIDQLEDYIIRREKDEDRRKRVKKKLLIGKEVIKILRISKQTLWRMRTRGEIVFIKRGNVCLYTQEEIEKVINNKIIKR